VFDLLREGPRPVGELADELPVSRPAVSQHLAVLRDAGLVVDQRDGRRNLYRIDPNGLAALRTDLETMWDDVLGAFADAAARATEPEREESR
jgi:DNA-binding transcriptional ArsR family regulator